MKDDPLSRREQMVLWRRLCRFIFKYMPVLAAGVFATYSLLAVHGLGNEIAVRSLFGVGLTPWLVLMCVVRYGLLLATPGNSPVRLCCQHYLPT